MPGDEQQTQQPTTPTTTTTTTVVEEKPVGQEPAKVELTTAQLADRNARAVKSTLKKEFGTEDPSEVKAKLDKLAQYEQEAEKARQASLSEQQKLNEQLAAEKAAREAAEQRAAAAEFDAHTSKLYAELGIKNADYATFKLGQELAKYDGKPEAEKLNEKEFLTKLLADKTERAALGFSDAPIPTVDNPPTTSPGNGNPPAPKPAGAPGGKKTAFDMTPAEWSAYKQQHGL